MKLADFQHTYHQLVTRAVDSCLSCKPVKEFVSELKDEEIFIMLVAQNYYNKYDFPNHSVRSFDAALAIAENQMSLGRDSVLDFLFAFQKADAESLQTSAKTMD